MPLEKVEVQTSQQIQIDLDATNHLLGQTTHDVPLLYQ
jgi:hypothetical protein